MTAGPWPPWLPSWVDAWRWAYEPPAPIVLVRPAPAPTGIPLAPVEPGEWSVARARGERSLWLSWCGWTRRERGDDWSIARRLWLVDLVWFEVKTARYVDSTRPGSLAAVEARTTGRGGR